MSFNSKTQKLPEDKSDDVFTFTSENLKKAKNFISQYPRKQSAIMPLLYLAQDQNHNSLSKAAMDYIAKLLDMPPMHVYEVATFYTMYNKKPVGQYLIQICRTTPCWLCGSDKITQVCKDMLGIDIGQTTVDKKFSLMEVECLGACVAGPVVQINNDYYENLDENKMRSIIEQLAGSEESKNNYHTNHKTNHKIIKINKTKAKKAK